MLDFEDVYDEMEDFVYWLANNEKREQIFLMDPDELIGELFEEMWKVFLHYQDDIDNLDEMKKVIKSSFDNRISELVYKYAVTHRSARLQAYSLDDPDDPEDYNSRSSLESHIVMNIGADVCVDTDMLVISKERVEKTFIRLRGGDAAKVFSAVIHGDPLLKAQIQLSGLRASHVYKGGGTIKLKKWHVANALAMSERRVSQAFKEIRRVYEEVCNEYDG